MEEAGGLIVLMAIAIGLFFLGCVAGRVGFNEVKVEAVQKGYAEYDAEGNWQWKEIKDSKPLSTNNLQKE